MAKFHLIILFFCIPLVSFSNKYEKRIYRTERINKEALVIDGLIMEKAWEEVPWQGDFMQRAPNEGEKPTQETEFKILYDDNYLYVAIRAWDNEPEKIDRRMSRRDGFEGDWVEINIDSYFDKQTAFSFAITASGVKGDEAVSNDGDNWDSNWNPVWWAETTIDSKGWVAEMKIPFDQLRFNNSEEQVWGLQVNRKIFRKEERSNWQPYSMSFAGWVQHFGELHGITGIKPQKERSLTPYVVSKVETFEKVDASPYATGFDYGFNAGIDGKFGITNDLTFDFTINPDFGQVEADPSEVNLSGFETYFSEKRPFFIEGSNITNFNITYSRTPMSRDNLFYSRRIGRKPQYTPDTDDNEFIDMPDNTTILGACKLTGKTKKGWSIGVVEAMTSKEVAEIDSEGSKRKTTVEPFTNYFVGRLQKDLNEGNTIIGGMATSTNRWLEESIQNEYHKSAYTAGIDLQQYWKDKKYYLYLKTVYSNVKGTKEAIRSTQESSPHYLQRPDAKQVRLDTNLTSLQGHGGTLQFGKQSSGKFRFLFMLTWRSPGCELNDLGYQRRADQLFQLYWMGYKITKPVGILRKASFDFNQWTVWNFDGDNIFRGGEISFNTQFTNHWEVNGGALVEDRWLASNYLRGGPSLIMPPNMFYSFGIESDSRKKLEAEFKIDGGGHAKNSFKEINYSFELGYRPFNSLSIEIEPQFSLQQTKLQYINYFGLNNNDRYVFGSINRKTLSMTMRINFNINPEFTIQYYGQPFIGTGRYTDFKYILDGKADDFEDRYALFNENEVALNDDNEYEITETASNLNYSFDNPDFNFKEFRSNLVVRWEYVPGSIVYLVWSQGKSENSTYGNFLFSRDFRDLMGITSHNIFLVKFAYRFAL